VKKHSAVYVHLVFSTKNRRPFLHDKPMRDALHSYLGGVSKQPDCPPICVGSLEDHVHLLARFGRTITQAPRLKGTVHSNLHHRSPRRNDENTLTASAGGKSAGARRARWYR
jgi:REP element-mobilizing transposase RayT